MKLSSRRALASFLVVLVFACTVRAQVLNHVPDDALLVIKTKDLTATSAKVGKWMKDLGLAQMKPGLDNPLALLQKELGIQNGLNANGEMAFVYRDPAKTSEKPEKSVMLLIPVSDFNAFVGNFKDPKVEGDVTEVTMPKGGDPGFIAKWGDFAVLSPSKAVAGLKASMPLKINGAATNKELGGKDVVFFANFAALRDSLMPHFQQGRDKVLEEMEGNLAANADAAKFRPLIKATVSQVFLAVESFLRDADAATISVNFVPEGLNVAVMADFVPNSYLGNMFASVKNTNEPLLAGLPTGKYLFFGGYKNQADVSEKCIDDFVAPIMKELDAMGPDMKPAHDYVDALKAYVRATKSSTFGVVAPSGALGQEAIFQLLSISKGDVPAMKAAQVKMVQAQEATMKAFGMPADAYSSKVTAAAKTVDGVAFDSITTTMNPDSKDPMAMQQAQIMAMVYGPGGMNMLQGEVNNETLLIAMGVPDQTLQSAITAAKASDAPLGSNAAVKSVAAQLPTNRTSEFYVPIDQVVTTALTYARQFGRR